MNTSTLKFFIVESPKTKFSDEQVVLSELAGKQFSRNEAEIVFGKIMNHKWNMSEKLDRDVGLRVATIDYMENFYQSGASTERPSLVKELIGKSSLRKFIRFYFESKSKAILA